MKNRTTIILLIIIVLFTAVASLLAYQQLPEQVASHWNAQGQANGYSSRLMGVLYMPIILLVTSVLLLCLPAIDPLKANITVFRGTYNLFIILFAGFMAYMHILTLLWNLEVAFSFNAAMAPALFRSAATSASEAHRVGHLASCALLPCPCPSPCPCPD